MTPQKPSGPLMYGPLLRNREILNFIQGSITLSVEMLWENLAYSILNNSS